VARPEPRPVLAPLAESTGPSKARRDDGIPIIPLKPIDERIRPARKPAPPTPSLHDVARAEVERHGGGAEWQWTPPKARPVPPITEKVAQAPTAAEEPFFVGEEAPLVQEDAPFAAPAIPQHRARPVAEPAAMRLAPVAEPVAIRMAPPDPADEEMILEELDLVDDDVPPPPTLPEVLSQVAGRAEGLVQQLLQRGRASAPSPARLRSLARTWGPRALMAMGVVAVLAIVVVTRSTWMGVLSAPRTAPRTAAPAPPAPATPEPSPLPREVQAAVAQLPHLSLDTIQLVMGKGAVLPDPPEVFRRAWISANRGASALSNTEAEELRSIKKAVLFSLRASDRDRVRAYDRVSVSVDLLVLEDGKVMAMFTRGVRALPPARRERLQQLLGKAITAALAPPFEARR
jgi:hypothetical protein